MLNQRLKALAFLLLAGFLGGFVLTSGSARWLKPPVRSAAAAEEQPAQDQPSPASAKKKKKGSDAGRDQEDGKTGVETPAAEKKGKAKVAADTSGPDEADDDVAAPTKVEAHAQDLSGEQAIAFLSGNTIQVRTENDGFLYRYMSRRGWRGDKDASGLVAHRWIAKGDRLCEVRSDGSVMCDTIAVRTEAKPKEGAGALLGTVTFADNKSWPVLRGNTAHLPEHLPLIETGFEPMRAPEPKVASATGQAAVTALVDHALMAEDPAGLHGFYYEPDGRWVEMLPLAPGAKTGIGGLKVSVGAWTFVKGALCLDRPGLELTRQCFRPEQWGDARFRLVPSVQGPARKLMVMADRTP